jgi:hypothetical protein
MSPLTTPAATNPFARARDLTFSRPALFQMREKGLTELDIYRAVTKSRAADVHIDQKTGHYVVRFGNRYRIVVRDQPDAEPLVVAVLERG